MNKKSWIAAIFLSLSLSACTEYVQTTHYEDGRASTTQRTYCSKGGKFKACRAVDDVKTMVARMPESQYKAAAIEKMASARVVVLPDRLVRDRKKLNDGRAVIDGVKVDERKRKPHRSEG